MLCPHCHKEIDEKPTNEATSYNVDLFRGDFHEYPAHLWDYAECLRDTWLFSLPGKPKKREKSQYSFWCAALEDVKQACGEKGVAVIIALHADYVEYAKTHGGTWPHTVAGPQSLINVARGKAATMREEIPNQKVVIRSKIDILRERSEHE